MNLDLLLKLYPLFAGFRAFHNHKVEGLEHIPKSGAAIIVVNHSLVTYDIGLLSAAIFEATDRIARPLVDRLFFKIPGVAHLAAATGGVKGSPSSAKKLLSEGELICVAPGGMREALRPSKKKYRIDWHGRMGFARLAMEARVPIILAACPKADDLLEVYENPLTKLLYGKWKIPFFVAKGLGPTILPKPIDLIHYIHAPIIPPAVPKDHEEFIAVLGKFHHELSHKMQSLMDKGWESP